MSVYSVIGGERLIPTSESDRVRLIAQLKKKYDKEIKAYAKLRRTQAPVFSGYAKYMAEYPYTMSLVKKRGLLKKKPAAPKRKTRATFPHYTGEDDIVYPMLSAAIPSYAPAKGAPKRQTRKEIHDQFFSSMPPDYEAAAPKRRKRATKRKIKIKEWELIMERHRPGTLEQKYGKNWRKYL